MNTTPAVRQRATKVRPKIARTAKNGRSRTAPKLKTALTPKPAPTAKIAPEPKTAPSVPASWAGRVPDVKPGLYEDGLPLHQVEYLSCKMMLKPNHFDSRKSLFSFGDVVERAAKECGVGFSTKGYRKEPLKIREVLFVDTKDFRLYNNAFILRRRIPYADGFPVGDPEIVFKFRHPDIQDAAETDVRPRILGKHRVKFKCQALPLKERLGGIRLLFSHNVQFPRSAMGVSAGADILSFENWIKIFPALARLRKDPNEKIELVSNTIIEEVLQDIGMLDFGQGVTAKTDVGIWRTRGEHRPLIGEFAFQIKFKDRKELALEAMQRAETFFVALQYAAKDYIALKATKTGIVYGLLGNAPNSHE
jgi:hypothetical protein